MASLTQLPTLSCVYSDRSYYNTTLPVVHAAVHVYPTTLHSSRPCPVSFQRAACMFRREQSDAREVEVLLARRSVLVNLVLQ